MTTITHLPGYRFVEPIHAGSHTLVYRSVRECDRQSVVIKVLRNPFPSFNELVQFRNQYTIAKNLDHPHIVKPLALEPYQNSYALVMEDFGALSLADLLERDRPWENIPQTLARSLQITLQIGQALAELHHQRVIHKDLKPGNILINPDTQQVKLTDFSIASLLPRETQDIQTVRTLEGTLAYLAPEQTGRMNRGIDYRSDFYALGVTLYQLLTGQLPFVTDDPMELLHCHLAQNPVPVHQQNPHVPLMLSEITSKLMAKNAEDRYQSAFGLTHDLECCLGQWQAQRQMERFELGKRDVSDRFLIPEKLYGREDEVQTLLQAFDRVSQGSSELMLVAGFSGVGKTVVVNEVHKPIVKQRGYFIKGKFDQLNRTIPFAALVQALRDLMGQLLQDSDAELQAWKAKILAAVGDSGQVIVEVIPELEQIIGSQPAAVELSGTAAQNRFNLLFQKFIQVFTTPDHPLVMFLDDLQWADSASLNLMHLLMTELDTGYLLLIGAYRDNEVSPAHPLMLTIAAIAKAEATVNTITLQPLSPWDLNRLAADTLHCTEVVAQPLTDLVVQKTRGNPFFATQFLKALHQDGLIEFDWQAGHWQCNIAQVREAALTDDVVEFMALQLQKLPASTQDILKLAACIGNQFDLTTLAIVSERSDLETATILWTALQQGLVLPQSQIYKFYIGRDTPELVSESHVLHYRFLHDRVQQAAYSLIPDDQKQITHLKIGQLMLQNTPEALQEEHVFEIVSQLNYGVELLTDQTERDRLAQLNLKVGRKALASTAYEAAVGYFKVGRELLASNAWELHYALCLALHESAAEAAYLSGDFAAMEQLVEQVLQQSNSILDRIKAYEIKIQAYASQTQFIASLEVALEGLQHLNVYFPSAPTGSDIETTFANVTAQVQTITIANLANLPPMQDAHARSSLRLLAGANASAFQAAPNLFVLIVLKMVSLSIEYGNSAESPLGYGLYGLLMSCILGDWETGYQLGQLALNLLDNFHDKQIECKTKFVVNASVRFRREHLRQTIQSLQEAYQIGLENGDIEFAGYSILHHCDHCFFLGDSLFDLEQKIPVYIASLEKLKEVSSSNILRIYLQTIFHLTQESSMPGSLIGEAYNELQDLPRLQAAQNQKGLFYLYFAKLFLHYFFQDFDQALTTIQSLENYLEGGRGNAVFPIFNFYDSLTRLALYSQTPEAERENGLEQVNVNQQQLRQWAAYAPLNYQHKWFLVEAERNRVLGLRLEAIENYDRAIAGAKENGYIQEESLANELAAKFYLDWGKEKVAAGYMQEAYYGYARWGAKAKTDRLEDRYPQLLAPILQAQRHRAELEITSLSASGSTSVFQQTATTSRSNSSHPSDAIDFAAILKASQVLSSEIQLEQLVTKLLQVVMENSGAKKAALLMFQDDSLTVEAIATLTDAGMTLLSLPLSDSDVLPLKLIHYVKRSLSTIVLDDATTQTEFATDPYLAQHQPRSLLCTPIVNQGKLIGLLYLENSLTIAAFTRDRLEVIHLLCTQAAISLENARLYRHLQTSEARYQRLAENVPGVIYQFQITATGEWQTPYFSAGCSEMFEVSPEQAMADAQVIAGMVHPEDKTEFEQSIALSAQTLQPWKWAGRVVLPSGQIKWIQGTSRSERQEDGSTVWDGLLLDISDRKLVEQQLSMSIKALDSHFDTSLFAIIEWDKERKIKRWSEHAEQIFGWSEAEIQAMDIPAWKFVYEEDFGWVSSQMQALRNGLIKRSKFENRNYRKDGTVITCEWHSSTIFDDAGNLLSMLTFTQDITDRKQTETELRQQKEVLQTVFDHLPVMVGLYSATGEVLMINRELERVIGWAKEEYQTVDVLRECYPNREDYEQILGYIMTADSIWHDSQLRTRDGQILDTSWAQIRLSDGRSIGIGQDITDRKAAEVALAESQKQYQNLVENSPDIIERFDLELRHLYISPALTKMTGISAAEFLGKTCRDLGMDENMINNWESAASRLRATGQRQAIEFETPTLNGIRSFEMAIVPELSDQQTIESMLCISRDISDRKQFAATLQQRLQREQSLNRVFQSIRQSFELEIIFATATAETSRLLGGLNCNVVQYLPAQGIWKRIVEFRSEPNRPPHVGLEIPDAGNPVAEQLKRLQTVRIESTDQLTDPISQDIARALPGAWLLIPLQVENRVWGSFTLSTQEQPFAWTDEKVELAQTVAAQLEVAIQQAELYQQVEQEKQNLLKSQTALLQAQQIAQVGSWELDAATQAMVWSDTLYQIFGFDPALPELDFAEVMMNHVHPEDRPRLEQALMQAMTQGIAYEIDLRIFRADGSMGYMEARAEAMRNEQGDIVKIFGTSLDISDRKQAEQQLQTLVEATAATTGQDFFPTLVSHMATALNVTYALVTEEVDGMLHALAFWANGALQPTFVYHPAKTPCEWTLRDGMFYCPCLVQQIFPQDLDLVQMGAESYLGIALRDSQGRAIGNLCILNTQPIPEPQQAENLLRVFAARASAELERERATQALEQLNQELEAIVSQRTAALTQRTMQLEVSNKELESFSYSVSHDLRAPLRHVNGFVNALQQRLQNHAALSDPKVVHYLQVIENSSQKMAQLIDGLLALSRIGRKPITYSPVSLRELVDEAIALAQNNPDTTIPVEFVIGELPTIQGDATLLQQVLSNLIGNAVKFSCHHPTPRIEIGSLPGGTIFIRDNGVGFQMEYADKLFGAFQRLHAQTEFEGTGIGLAIVQRIIHRHGGTIWAESQPNQGATFHFTLGNAVER